MNTRVLVPCAALAGLFITACSKKQSGPEAPPANSSSAAAEVAPGPEPAGPTEAEKKLAEQIRELEAKQAEMQLQMEEERLAATEAEIAKERDLLAKEREAWRLELELAEAKAALPVRGSKTAVPVVAGAVTTTSENFDYQMFYDELAPFGSWFESPEYGYVWQPSVCVSDDSWRPYTHGRWACADQGWTWCSDEPFGWACYHYGRWARLREIGWVWVPGDQWAPSWVAWRKNGKYVGWCPLPPETVYDRDCTYGETIDSDCGIDPGGYVFVPVSHFDEPVLGYCEAPSICLTICRTTVNITNIIIRPGRVECPGPRYDWIRECVRRPVPRYTIACEFERREHNRGRGHRVEKDRIHCFAPGVRAPWNAGLRPARTTASVAGAEVVRGEGGLPGQLGSRFHQERQHRIRTAQNPGGASGKLLAERQQRLAGLEETREALHEKLRLESKAARASAQEAATDGKLAGSLKREGKRATRPGNQHGGEAVKPPADKRSIVAKRPEPAVSRANGDGTVPATPAPVARPAQQPVIGPAPANPDANASDNARLAAAREELARLRAARETAGNTVSETPPKEPVVARNDKRDVVSGARENSTRRQQDEPQKSQANDRSGSDRAAMEQQRREAATAARNEAAAREAEKQTAARAALEERRRLLEAQKEQAAQERATMEEQRRGEAANQSRRDEVVAARAATEERRRQQQQQESQNDAAKQQAANERSAMERQRRQADADARAEQLAQQRAALEQQRRQAEVEARSEQQQRQREAAEQQRRQAEADARAEQQQRQREAAEQQRRQAEAEARAEQQQRQREAAEQQRRQEAEARAEQQQRQREAAEQNRRQAEEQSRRQAEEQNRRQAEEQSRRQADEQRSREASEREGKGRR